MKVNNYLLIGNDPKMQECKNHLIYKGYVADISADYEILQKLNLYDCLILPLPTISNGYISGTRLTFDEILEYKDNNQYVLCGNILCSDKNNCLSYYYNEAFLIKNSQLTAQGVLKIILESTYYSVFGMKVAVIGYGRCGKMISKLLKNVGMDVTVFSRRNETMTQSYFDGYTSVSTDYINDLIQNYDITVNTVPSNIITNEGIKKLTSRNVYIEVASKPYGLNINESDVYNFKYILADSLPGRFTPKSAGVNIADTVIEILKEV